MTIFILFAFELLTEVHYFCVVVRKGPTNQGLLLSNFLLIFGKEVVEMVVLLVEVCTVLSQFGSLLSFFSLHFLELSFLFLESPVDLLIFPVDDFFAFLHHLHFLLEVALHGLAFLYFFIPSLIFYISNFLLKVKLIVYEYIVQLFVFHGKVLHRRRGTLRFIYSPLHFSSRFLIFLSNSKVRFSTYS